MVDLNKSDEFGNSSLIRQLDDSNLGNLIKEAEKELKRRERILKVISLGEYIENFRRDEKSVEKPMKVRAVVKDVRFESKDKILDYLFSFFTIPVLSTVRSKNLIVKLTEGNYSQEFSKYVRSYLFPWQNGKMKRDMEKYTSMIFEESEINAIVMGERVPYPIGSGMHHRIFGLEINGKDVYL
ncbi:MAG: hypothetical protein Q8L29_01990 [archaeon]|nr:hypothetical protein [archaeon]